MRKELERRPHPALSVLPVGLFALALVVDFAALLAGFTLFGRVALVVLWMALAYAAVASTVLLIDFTIFPVGSLARRARGLAAATTSALVVVFAVAGWSRATGDPAGSAGLFLLEVVGVLVGATGVALAPAGPAGQVMAWRAWLLPPRVAPETITPWF